MLKYEITRFICPPILSFVISGDSVDSWTAALPCQLTSCEWPRSAANVSLLPGQEIPGCMSARSCVPKNGNHRDAESTNCLRSAIFLLKTACFAVEIPMRSNDSNAIIFPSILKKVNKKYDTKNKLISWYGFANRWRPISELGFLEIFNHTFLKNNFA